jgi:hypothetical protein
MSSASEFPLELSLAFPARVVHGDIAPHQCEECAAIRAALSGRTWTEVPDSFAEEFSGSLPLLTEEAYNAYLPVWLRAALANPSGDAATMLLINLANDPPATSFNMRQARTVIEVARSVVKQSYWGPEDEGNIANLKAIEVGWSNPSEA